MLSLDRFVAPSGYLAAVAHAERRGTAAHADLRIVVNKPALRLGIPLGDEGNVWLASIVPCAGGPLIDPARVRIARAQDHPQFVDAALFVDGPLPLSSLSCHDPCNETHLSASSASTVVDGGQKLVRAEIPLLWSRRLKVTRNVVVL
jgi:hypothetical protein